MKKETFKNRIALQGGTYSLVITAIACHTGGGKHSGVRAA